MKLLILITLSIVSLNAFSAELGEDKKGECAFSNQSSKREAKAAVVVNSESKKPTSATNISK